MLAPELLNRVNKDLKQRVDALGSELQTYQATVRLEGEVVNATKGKLQEARQKFTVAKNLNSQAEVRHGAESERHKDILRAVEKSKSDLFRLQGASKDAFQKLETTESRVEETRARLHVAQDVQARQELAVMQWLEENRLTQNAADAAGGIMQDGDTRISSMRREAETLTVNIRRAEEDIASGMNALDQLEKEIAGARLSAEEQENEKRRTKAQIEELAEREEELKALYENIGNNKKDLVALVDTKRKEVDAFKMELREVQSSEGATLRRKLQLEGERNRLVAALQEAKVSLSSAEHELALLEQHTGIAAQGKNQQYATLEQTQAKLQEECAKFEMHEEKRAAVAAALVAAERGMDTLDQDSVVHGRLLAAHMREVETLHATIERGAQLIRDQHTKHVNIAREADGRNTEIVRLRDLQSKSTGNREQQEQRMAHLTATIQQIDEDIVVAKAKVDEALGVKNQANAAEYEAKKQEIEVLKEQVEVVEDAVRRSKRAVTSARSAVRAAEGDTGSMDETMATLESQATDLENEINSLHVELQNLSATKQQAAETAEGLFWRVERVREQAASQAAGVTDKLQERNALEFQARIHDKELRVTYEANLVELHAHEDEKRKLVLRHGALAKDLGTLKSRYESLMESLNRQVKPPPGLDEKGAQAVVPVNDEETTPEDLQARHMLYKAVERDQLLEKGNRLDGQIVVAEKDLQRLETIFGKMKQESAEAHQNPLLLIEGYQESEAAAEEQFLAEVRGRLEEAERDQGADLYREEITRWSAECNRLVSSLSDAKEREASARAELVAVSSERDETLRELRAKQRQLDKLSRDHAAAAVHTRNVASALRVKSTSFFSDPNAGKVIEDAKQEDAVDATYYNLQASIVRAAKDTPMGDRLYFRFRELADRYGLSTMVNVASSAPPQRTPGAAVLSTVTNTPVDSSCSSGRPRVAPLSAQATARRSHSTNAGSRPVSSNVSVASAASGGSALSVSGVSSRSTPLFEPSSRRPATKALVEAMASAAGPQSFGGVRGTVSTARKRRSVSTTGRR